MADFHFLRPWWLALLPIGLLLIWRTFRARNERGGWAAVIDPELRPYVLTTPQLLRESRLPMLLGLAILMLALLALAGPTWERLPVPAFRSDEALVVALDLSRSMDAADLTPSRLARAKLKLLALLERRQAGQTALVVFTTHAFTVTPLTTDTRTIASLVNALDSGIMPSQGSSVSAGLAKAGALLRQTGLSQGEILLITDSEVADTDRGLADDLGDEGYRVHVLAVGTEQGAPIAESDGGFLTDSNGQVVIPRLAPDDLESLAAAGGGRFARLAPDDRDLDALFPPLAALSGATLARQEGEEYEADVWRDQGAWLVVALLPLLALTFRRGWIYVLVVGVLSSAPRADAFEWADIWQRRDQRGYEALQSDQAQRAAELFENPEWRGAAHYRAGAYTDSAASLDGVDTAEAHYNRGNALAKGGNLVPAIAEYDRALELDSAHEDARYNRDLLAEFLKQNPESQNQDSGGEQGGEQQQQQADANGQQGAGEQGSKAQQQSAESQGEQSTAQDSPGQGSDDQPGDSSDETQSDQEEDLANEQGEQTEGDTSEGEAAPGPEDVEQWASEQAAEQWLRRIPQDPGGLLRRKFLYQYQRLGVDQEGNSVWPGESAKPW
jgi:Ca-activated chloride channel family protein